VADGDEGAEGGDGEVEGGVGVACAGARGETVPNGVGVAPPAWGDAAAAVSPGARSVGAAVGVALGAARVESGGVGVGGGSDLQEHAAVVVANRNAACTAKRRRFALISDFTSACPCFAAAGKCKTGAMNALNAEPP
jgi:hypothetical protein